MKVLFYLFFFYAQIALSQDLSYRIIGKEQGLPTNTIYDLMQDKQGFIWVATNKGVFRYDGVNFKAFSNTAQNGKSVSNLFEDKKGRIWCQNFVGQFFFVENDSMYFFSHIKPTGQYFPAGIIGENTLFSYETNQFTFTNLSDSTQKNITDVHFFAPHIQIVNQKINLLNLKNEILTFDGALNSTQTRINIENITMPLFFHLQIQNKRFLCSKSDMNEIWLIENGAILKIDLPQKYLLQNIKMIDDKYFALCTSSGLYFVDYKENRLVENRLFLKNKSISSIIKDKEGNFWIGTINSGLIFAANLSTKIQNVDVNFTRIDCQEQNNTFFAATSDNRIYKLNTKKNHFQLIYNPETNVEITALYFFAEKNKLFIGSNKLISYEKNQFKILKEGSIKDIEKYNDKTIAIAATGFVDLFNFEDSEKNVYLKSNARNRTILVAPDKAIYIGTSKGFWKHHQNQATEIKFENNSLFFEDMIWHDGKIFAASQKNGMFCFQDDKIIEHLTTKDGLADNALLRIKSYKNKIWWLTEKTLQQYDPTTKKIITYDKSNGLPDTELKDLGFFNDTVYVATAQGIAYFPINLIEKLTTLPPKIIANLVFEQKEIDTKITNEFAHNENDIEIHFSILSFRNAEQLQVYYQINGQKWLKLGKNVRVLSLPALAPNDYNIKIKAENGKNISIAEINFVVKPPFWLSYWFLAICVWFLLFSFALIYLYRVKKLEQKAAQMAQKMALEQQLQKSLLSSIKSQMNPHFIFNALNTIQSYIYLNEKQNAANYLVKFSELTRMILDMSNSETVSLRDELKTIHLYLELEQMRFEDTLVYTIEIAKNIELDTTKIPSMLIQPYIENAIKHGLMHKKEDRKLSLNFSIQQHFLIVSVEDNGVGRKKANEINQQRASKHQSFATNANQKRLELLNIGFQEQIGIDFFDKFDENSRAAGTKVTLKIPMTTFNALQK